MKLRSFILSAAAAVMAFAACENEQQNLGAASVTTSTKEISFTADGGDQEIQITATRDWTMQTDADWVIVDPESGPASASAQKITISALENDSYDRTATIRFKAGPKFVTVKVNQAGPEGSADALIVYYNDFQVSRTSEKPYLDASLSVWDNKKGSGVETVKYAVGGKMSVRTTGKLSDNSEVPDPFSNYAGSGGNKIFFGAATSIFKIQNITLPASVYNYKLSFGGQKWGQDNPDNTFSFDEFKVYVGSDSQKWVPLTMSHEDGADLVGDWNQFFASFTVPAEATTIGIAFVCSASSLYNLDDVLLEIGAEEGQTIDFANGIDISGTTEIVGSGSVEDLPEGTGEGTLESPYDAAKATRVASELADGEKIEGVYVKGKIKSIKEIELTTYHNASYYLTDEDGIANFYVYAGNYLGNTKFTSANQIKVGDEVVVYGNMVNFKGNTPELESKNYIVELNGSTEAPETPDTPDVPVTPGETVEVTCEQFVAATDNTVEYQVSGIISGIYQAYNAEYNNISIYIADETGEILAYRLSCVGVDDPANTLTKGDRITVKGMRTLYNEKPQMAQGCVIVSHEDVIVEVQAGGVTLSFADKANRTSQTANQQVWEQNGVKLINDKGSSTSNVGDYAAPARFYKSSKLTVEYPGMTKIVFVCSSGEHATALKESITVGTVTVLGSDVTVVLSDPSDSYVVEKLSAQVRMDSLTVYAE